MKKKISISTTVTLVLLAMALTISLTMLLAMRHFNNQLQLVSKRQAMYSHINEVDKVVREYYPDLDEALLRQGIAQGYIDGIDDPYAAYYATADYEIERMRTAGRAKNIGIVLGERKDESGATQIVITRVYEGSAAANAGIKADDVVVSINGELVATKKLSEWQALADTASELNVTVSRGAGEPSYPVKAFEYDVLSVQSLILNNVGYIKITAFYDNTPEQFKDAVDMLLDKKVLGLVFDLRGNAGGSSKAVQDMLSQIMPLGAYGTVTDTKGNVTKLSTKVSKAITLPTVTLINGTTAGEAEFFAGALQEAGLTYVMGETSYGKAKYQQYFVLEQDYSALKLTVGEYGLMKGGSWEGKGIEPSTIVTLPPEQAAMQSALSPNEDAQVQAAVDRLEEGAEPEPEPEPEPDSTTSTSTDATTGQTTG